MRKLIYIVGALEGDPKWSDLISALNDRNNSVDWEWLRAETTNCRPPESFTLKALGRLRRHSEKDTTIVKLLLLDGKTANQFFSLKLPLVNAPKHIRSKETLIDWLFSNDANLFPRKLWMLGDSEAAFIAILSKLLRGKYWNKDVQGHEWLKESDLINQSPVKRSGFDRVRKEAIDMIPRLLSLGILLTKGASQGNTPKEYSINTEFLPPIKRSINQLSLTPLCQVVKLTSFVDSLIRHKSDKAINVLDGILSEQAIAQCKEEERDDEND